MHVQLLLNNRGFFCWLEMRETFEHTHTHTAVFGGQTSTLLFDFGWNASDIWLFKN